MKKTKDYKLISAYEDKLDLKGTASFDLMYIFVLSSLGLYSYLINPGAVDFTNFILGFTLFGFIIFAVVPANAILRVYVQDKNQIRKRRDSLKTKKQTVFHENKQNRKQKSQKKK